MRQVDFRLHLFGGLIKRYKSNDTISEHLGKNSTNILQLIERHFPNNVKSTAKNKHFTRHCIVSESFNSLC